MKADFNTLQNEYESSRRIFDINGGIVDISRRIRMYGRPCHVGLTGGVASGKTTVADMFHDLGAHLVDFDILAREVVLPGTKGLADVVNAFGKSILQPCGTLDRKALSKIVFRNPEKRKTLEAILHPAIFELFVHKVDAIVHKVDAIVHKVDAIVHKVDAIVHKVPAIDHKEPSAFVFAVIPLLIEMNLQHMFDKIIVVHVSSEIQLQRLMLRDNIDDKEALTIMASQLPIDEKLKYADFSVDNSGGLENSRLQVKNIWKELSSSKFMAVQAQHVVSKQP
ncbi:Dephospho-CoA kinase (modular protein) [Desulfamplus magnetovallimortis]|uniref:Dephospho-CoA kinase n=1 Tax=Desulfamplus magnetovallimortis TaxID=1246637 RepID=A0A1W1HGV7_9BACT|nr:dephospho-CoA kinase [Desulfamplus magnetovallimortis]SLM31618.1 Dephospho-CoA kinase (modular protein) [Desulfamplus magnetovallimortis]